MHPMLKGGGRESGAAPFNAELLLEFVHDVFVFPQLGRRTQVRFPGVTPAGILRFLLTAALKRVLMTPGATQLTLMLL